MTLPPLTFSSCVDEDVSDLLALEQFGFLLGEIAVDGGHGLMVSGSADYGGLFLGADQIADREREKRRGAALDFGVYKLGREKRHGFLQAVWDSS